MKVLFLSVEVSPYAKVGGLADVAGSLPKALAELGHDVVIAMPAYGMAVVNEGLKDPKLEFWSELAGDWPRTEVFETQLGGARVWMLDNAERPFRRLLKSEEVYLPSRDDYLFYAKAAMDACAQAGWIPDVIHANDWHTAFSPVLLREKMGEDWAKVASVYTIHNLAYQGEFGKDTLEAAGLDDSLFTPDRLETYGGVNFIKSGCVFADRVNTVSPRYAEEIQTEEFGCGLHGLMASMAAEGKLNGILNGIDMERFDPTNDPDLAASFSADDPSGKAKCRQALIDETGLDADLPMFGVVSRLSDQKGFDLIVEAADRLLSQSTLIVLGTGDPWAASELRRLQEKYPKRLHFAERFDVAFAQRIYGGSDLFLMPSAFEPCGLGQLIAMRYGTVPVVRSTGGLVDTIQDGENGFAFEHKSAEAMLEAIERSIAAFKDKGVWAGFVDRAMRGDYAWMNSAKLYAELYQDAINARSRALVGS